MDRMEQQRRTTPRTPVPDPRPLGPVTHLTLPPFYAPPATKSRRERLGIPDAPGDIRHGSAAPQRGAGNCATSHDGAAANRQNLAATAALGCDAVGTPREHGQRIMDSLPRVGCVFADDQRWWWIVPSGSHVGVTWPPSTRYAIGAQLADPSWTRTRPASPSVRPRLIHSPEDGSPYTPPIPLYFLACRLAGSVPSWSLGTGG
ncbi:hypothetical protein [Streptomyces sp. NPDC000878]